MTGHKKQSAGCRGYGVCRSEAKTRPYGRPYGRMGSRVFRVASEHGWVPCFCLQKHAFRLRFATPKKHGTLPRSSRGTPQSAIRNPKSARQGGACRSPEITKAFTLIELLVAVSIMILMMLAFGLIITESQQVVSSSQAIMRTNGTASSIAYAIRNDLRKLTKNGFLCITRYGSFNRPYLLFSTAGMARSKLLNYTSTGGLSTYGFSEDGSKNILFHQGWLAIKFNPAGNDYDAYVSSGVIKDVLNVGMEDLQKMPRVDINIFINDLYTSGRIPWNDSLAYPPQTLSDLNDTWQFLSDEIVSLGIMWTDGTRDPVSNELYWYGVDSGYNAEGKDSVSGAPSDEWTGLTIASEVAEFDAGSGAYRALWTRHDQNNWPTAIRIKFKVRDPSLSETGEDISAGIWYEVICPVGQ